MAWDKQGRRRVLKSVDAQGVRVVDIARVEQQAPSSVGQAKARLLAGEGGEQVIEVTCPCGDVIEVVCQLESE